ncbi:type II secretion system minor pseudopilin [Methylobacterium oxalidis]|uniref:general secretion pathway protein GspK n=1 Tax=Methylobacterium oxalidis TaxID=944322 RepID=UPI00331475B9
MRRVPAPAGRSVGASGFVLPMVLAVLMAVAAGAMAATQLVQTRVAVTASRLNTLRLQGLADGAARLAAVSLLVERGRRLPGLGLPENGTAVACALSGGVRLQVTVQDQAGLIDLGTAPRTLMEDAFRALGVPDRDATTLAAEIVDYRDPDDVPEPGGGAEAPQYRSRGLAYGPRNGPFATIDELDQLPSMTEDMAARLRPAVTVYNPGGGFDPALAPTRALSATVSADALRPYAVASAHQAYEIRVVAEDAAGARAGRAAMLAVNGRAMGTGLLAWRYTTAISAAAIPHPACAAIRAAIEAG